LSIRKPEGEACRTAPVSASRFEVGFSEELASTLRTWN
jgi:hypothetical protein